MKQLKILFLLLATVLAVACDSGKTSSFQKGNPYGKEFMGLNGPVKYALYNHYKKGYVDKATRMDYSPAGVLTKKKIFEAGDSIVNSYTYDPDNHILSISGNDFVDYKNEYKKGTLVKEWFYTNEAKDKGYTLRYKIEDETLIKKQNDIATGAGITTTYVYNSKGIVQQTQQMVNDGAYTVNKYDDDNHLTAIEHYDPKGNLLYEEEITADYDEYDNCIKYTARKNGKLVTYYKVMYKYYTEDELKNADQQVELSVNNSDRLSTADPSELHTPGPWLLVTIGILTLAFWGGFLAYAKEHWNLFEDFGGSVEIDGMRKMWMYNSNPYIKMGIIFASAIASFLASIALIVLCGGIVWILFWAVKLILWGIIIIGWVLLVGGILALFAKEATGLIAAIVGGIIVAFQSTLERWGELFVEWGGNILDKANVIDWTISIFTEYGKTILMVIAIPIACFLALAVVLIIFSYILRLIEFTTLKIYNVNRPCPYCGNTHDFVYMIGKDEYPIPLHPGMYGIFHQTNHDTGVRVPTMLLNGKAKLTRKCKNCGQRINVKKEKTYGTDIHIGIVGARSSGKSYLLYSGLELMTQKFGKDFQQVDVDQNNNLSLIANRIHHNDGIQTADKNRYKAIQFKMSRKFRPVPYHLFFYDVAGEKFNVNSATSRSALEFYNNVKTVVFVIDPTMTDTEKVVPSTAFSEWFNKHGNKSEAYDIEGILGEFKKILDQVGRKPKDIDVIITCTKKDLGYLKNSDYPYNLDESMVKKFISEELGLANLVNSTADFKSVSFAAVSATDKNRNALSTLFLNILKQRGIKID